MTTKESSNMTELTSEVLNTLETEARWAIGDVPPDPLPEHVPMEMEACVVLALVAAARERDTLRATVARVEALHVVDPTIVDEYAYCRECSEVWPCDTTKALRGEDQ